MAQPTEDEVLAARTADALFGDAARDLAALKRAYAALVRRFRPESSPAVFAHVHALFTAARDALEGEVAREAASAAPTARAAPEVRPGEPAATVRRTPSEAALQAVETWLDDETAVRGDPRWWGALSERLRALPWTADETIPLRVLALLDEIPPAADAEALVLARRAAKRLAWARAAQDPQVPKLILDTLAACDEQSPATTVRALYLCACRLRTLDATAVQRHLERRHPTLVAMLHEALHVTEGRLTGRGWRVELSWETVDAMRDLVERWMRWEVEQRRSEPWTVASRSRLLHALGVVLALGVLRLKALPRVAIGGVVVAMVVLVWRLVQADTVVAHERRSRNTEGRAELRARLEPLLRELALGAGLFAEEFADVLAELSPPGGSDRPSDHPATWFVVSEVEAVRWVGARQLARVVRAWESPG